MNEAKGERAKTVAGFLKHLSATLFAYFRRHAKWTYPLAGLILLVLLGGTALDYTENPRFCLTCHVMRPFYKSWRESSHNFVRCVECHYSPGMKAHIKTKFEALVQVIRYINGCKAQPAS